MNFSREEILSQLDRCAAEWTFPVFDNGYVYFADARLTAYADSSRWALTIEVLGYSYKIRGTDGFDTTIYLFGNCLTTSPGMVSIFHLITDGTSGNVFEYEEYINRQIHDIRIRGHLFPLPFNDDFFSQAGVVLAHSPKIHGAEFLRALSFQYRDILFATSDELRIYFPKDLPLLLTLDAWYHPDIADDQMPSDTETFSMIADVLVSHDQHLYQPTLQPNTHWSHWPESGKL